MTVEGICAVIGAAFTITTAAIKFGSFMIQREARIRLLEERLKDRT